MNEKIQKKKFIEKELSVVKVAGIFDNLYKKANIISQEKE